MKHEISSLVRKFAFTLLRMTGGEKKTFWLDMVDGNTKRKAKNFIGKLKAGKIRNRHIAIYGGYHGPGD